MPGLIKAGFTMKDPEIRAQELGGTGSPHPFIVEHAVMIDEPREIEKKLHFELHQYHESKEWFRCTVSIAREKLKTVVHLSHRSYVVTHELSQSTQNVASAPAKVNGQDRKIWKCERCGVNTNCETLDDFVLTVTKVNKDGSRKIEHLCDKCRKSFKPLHKRFLNSFRRK